MGPKQAEMDDVIKLIYGMLLEDKERRSLLVLCGDHGMTEIGNHGGTSMFEIMSALVFVSPGQETPRSNNHKDSDKSSDDGEWPRGRRRGQNPDVVNQVDLVPSLSLLFGLPIPKNNRGTVILDLVGGGSRAKVLRALQLNAFQELSLLTVAQGIPLGDFETIEDLAQWGETSISVAAYLAAVRLHEAYYVSPTEENFAKAEQMYLEVLRSLQGELGAGGEDFRLPPVLLNVGVQLVLALWLDLTAHSLTPQLHRGLVASKATFSSWMVMLMFGAYFATYGASSFVEEEHQYWYFFVSSAISLVFFDFKKNIRGRGRHARVIFFFIFFRLARGWNQTGVKWAHITSLREWLVHPNQQFMVLLLSLGSFLYICDSYRRLLAQHGRPNMKKSSHSLLLSLFTLAGFMAFFYKVNQLLAFRVATEEFLGTFPEIALARLIYLTLLATLALGSWQAVRIVSRAKEPLTTRSGWEIFCGTWLHTFLVLFILLTRVHNAGLWTTLFITFRLLRDLINGLEISFWLKCLFMFALGQAGFFLLGNSNGIATVDLSGAYVGLSGYNLVLVGALTFTITTSGALFFHIAMLLITLDHTWKVYDLTKVSFSSLLLSHLVASVTYTTSFYLTGVAVYSGVLIFMRHHLFIWSVFSPKFLYQLTWTGVAAINFLLSLLWASLIVLKSSPPL